jgi:hypothetical protein
MIWIISIPFDWLLLMYVFVILCCDWILYFPFTVCLGSPSLCVSEASFLPCSVYMDAVAPELHSQDSHSNMIIICGGIVTE